MSLFGALFSGVSGLDANAQAMGVIADNIANVNAVGFKKISTRFSTLVTESVTATRYSPGGVTSNPLIEFERQGLMQSSSAETDIAIAGDGLFVVNESANPTATTGQYMFTRAGSFRPDKNGFLKNTAGLYLQGWPVDSSGNIPTNRSDLTALQTVNVSGLTGTAEPTTSLGLQLNLQSSTVSNRTGPQVTAGPYGVASTADLGTAGLGLVATTDGLTITSGAASVGPLVYGTDFTTMQQLADLINVQAGITATITNPLSNATLTITGDQKSDLVVVNAGGTGAAKLGVAGTVNLTYDETSPTLNLASGSVTPDFQRSVGIFDSKGGARTVTFSFLKSGLPNQWYTEAHVQPASSVTTTGALVNGQIATGLIAFNADGTLDLANSTMASILAITWAPGLGLQSSTLALDLGTDGTSDGLTQFDSPSNLVKSDVNGAIFGTLTGVSIGEDGFVTALFSNGTNRNIFKLAVATFPNPAGLSNETGNAFQPTDRAGDLNLLEGGLGGAGTIVASALEASTVDLAEEFTNIIVTQRAYSASSRIITTADQMLDELIRIIR